MRCFQESLFTTHIGPQDIRKVGGINYNGRLRLTPTVSKHVLVTVAIAAQIQLLLTAGITVWIVKILMCAGSASALYPTMLATNSYFFNEHLISFNTNI